MAKSGNFGWSSVQAIGSNSDSSAKELLKRIDKNKQFFLPVRVEDIILDSTHPKFKDLGEWAALGAIIYSPVTSQITENDSNLVAYPISSNIKNFPLINEIVYLISLPSKGIGLTNTNVRTYYLTTVGIWNHPHHTAYPLSSSFPSSQNKTYQQTQAGSTNIVSDQPIKINLGETFIERSDIHPLLPFEGDIIYEGRWGNSIRFGSTVKGKSNNWSSIGTNGDPITIIRNGQGDQNEDGYIPIVENINNMESSILLTSTQNVPINTYSSNYTSYSNSEYSSPITPSKYNGNQIILNSGRILLSSNSDHILFSSAKSINLNSQECITIDTKKVLIQSNEIHLGTDSLANEPLLLGNTTVEVLKTLTKQLMELTQILKTLESDPVVNGSPATFSKLNISSIGITTTLQSVLTELGTTSEDCKLTSKRNFTL